MFHLLLYLSAVACAPDVPPEPTAKPPAILLVTLDTTRADATGLESDRVETPHLEALATRGVVFSQAYTTAPMTLPAHTSMLTGLYPFEHGIRENARYLATDHVLLGERLQEHGYTTAAFVSALPLASQFGLARGFDHYDDQFAPAAERDAGGTTERALAYLAEASDRPLFLWVHYFDPHEPYEPPEPFRTRYAADPYLGEIAYMDQEFGRLVEAFASRFTDSRIVVAGDHGEGLGDHGEARHGNLLYQGVMRVPLVIADGSAGPATRPEAVSVRRLFDTILGWAGSKTSPGLLGDGDETVMAEAMKPSLQYGWQPQVMAVRGGVKVIRSGAVEIYDVRADPAESQDLAGQVELDGELRRALDAYPFLPEDVGAPGAELSPEDRQRLASLGYADWQGRTAYREGAPSPKDMTHLFAALDAGSGYFARQDYERAIPVFEKVLNEDPNNLMVALRLAVAHSFAGADSGERAFTLFKRCREIAPGSVDVDHYLAMHYFRLRRWSEAEPLFESVLARMPERLPALEALARIHEGQGRLDETAALLERIVRQKPEPRDEWMKLGELRMAVADTPGAIAAFEEARALNLSAAEEFSHFLELGVAYLADHRYAEARDCLDQVGSDHPGYSMALFKRAQASVLLAEPDAAERVRLAWEKADPVTRPLIEKERLFQGLTWR